MSPGFILALAALNGMLATGLAATGAHALPTEMLQADKALFRMATDFHLYVSLSMLATAALLAAGAPRKLTGGGAILFQVGAIAFSGSLYARALLGAGSLGSFHWITPLGGLLMILAWATLIAAGLRWHKAGR